MSVANQNTQVLLASYPTGLPARDNFRVVVRPVELPKAGQVLVRTLYLSMDPFPRLRMDPHSRMGPPLPLSSVVIGRGVGEVVASEVPGLKPGSYVAGELGWQQYAVCEAGQLREVDPTLGPVRASLGVLGPSGIAAFIALMDEGRPSPGNTVLVTAAAGAVGSVAGQLARFHGCRVVGTCIGADQARYLMDELGFDAALDTNAAADLQGAIRAVCPQGIDVLLDSVGGDTHNAAMMSMNERARAVVFGFISAYNQPADQALEYGRIYEVIRRRIQLSGFLVGDHTGRFPAALQALAELYRTGRLKCREHIVDGIEHTPDAFAALFQGAAPGKQLVRVAAEDSQRRSR